MADSLRHRLVRLAASMQAGSGERRALLDVLAARQDEFFKAVSTMTRDEFEGLAMIWEQDMAFISSTTQIMTHKAVGLLREAGDHIIPWCIEKLQGDCWVGWLCLLEDLYTKYIGPIPFEFPKEDYGNLDKLSQYWIKWWEDHTPCNKTH